MNTSSFDRYNLKQYSRLIISFFFCLLLLSIGQYTILFYKGVAEQIFSASFFITVAHQLGFASVVGLVLVIVFNFWENYRPKYGFIIVFFILSVLLLIEAALISYYCQVLVPLGSDILGYSFEDMKETISNSGGASLTMAFGAIILIGAFFGFYRLTSRFYHHVVKMFPFTIVLFSLFLMTLFIEGKPINQNKTQYLAVNLYQSSTEVFTYEAKEEYPLIRSNNTPDVLGQYFDLKEKKPNIVFFIVEGLGRDFVGENAEFEGFTPFIDSLSRKSLYWENCLSNTGRTFGVLPSLLGSLPFGKSGFNELEDYPNKLTLFTILKNNGYHTSYYQGTNSSFDNVDKFLLSENIDFVLDKSGFGKDFEQQEAAKGFSWGYPDKELFRRSFELKRDTLPRLEVYMTISNHEPFIPPNQEQYEQKARKILAGLSHNDKTKKIIEKNLNVFATLLYTDDAIKYAIEGFKKMPGYENTVFVITGDHRLIPIPLRNNLARFNVPLIIHSPMLKEHKKMSGISSHFDVPPTLLSMLNTKYPMQMPKKVAWLGDALDTHEGFRGTKDIPLMRNKNELKEYVNGDKFYSDGSLYQIEEGLELSTGFGTKEIENKFKTFKAINDYVTVNDKIIPDSLSIFTLKTENFTKEEMVWLNSLFNEYNSDKLFPKARELAFDNEYEKALLLCRFILAESHRHIDTKILMGRINAWNGNRDESIKLLLECINQNPDYIDSYAALFDVYYWDGRYKEGLELIETVRQNSSSVALIEDKITRAKREARKNGVTLSHTLTTETASLNFDE